MPKKKKRILFFVPIPPPYAGPEVANKMLLETETLQNAPLVHLNSNIRNSNSQKGRFDFIGVLAFGRKYMQVLSRLLFGRIHTFYFLLSSSKVGFLRDCFYIFTAKLLDKKLVAHYRGSNFDVFFNGLSGWYKKLAQKAIGQLDTVIVQGEQIAQKFEGVFTKEQLRVVYNGIKLSDYPAKPWAEDEVFTILFMGHLWFPKGFYDLVIAYKELFKKHGTKIQLLFAGENTGYQPHATEFLNGKWKKDYEENGRKFAAEISNFIADAPKWNARHLGFVSGEQKIDFLHSGTILVLPSYTEGFSMAVLEAMAVGLPVIVTPVGALSEIVQNDKNGNIVPLGSPEKLYAMLEKYLQNSEWYNAKGNYNRKSVEANFTIEHIAGILLSTITS